MTSDKGVAQLNKYFQEAITKLKHSKSMDHQWPLEKMANDGISSILNSSTNSCKLDLEGKSNINSEASAASQALCTSSKLDSGEPKRTLSKIDVFVESLFNIIEEKRNDLGEDWLFFIVSDHGGDGTGHGDSENPHINQTIFFSQHPDLNFIPNYITNQTDLAPTILDYMGVASEEIDCKMDGISIPYVPDYITQHSWYMYSVRVDPFIRDAVVKHLENEGIETRLSFPPVHTQPFIQKTLGYTTDLLPHTNQAWDSKIDIPAWPGITETDLEKVVNAMRSALDKENQ